AKCSLAVVQAELKPRVNLPDFVTTDPVSGWTSFRVLTKCSRGNKSTRHQEGPGNYSPIRVLRNHDGVSIEPQSTAYVRRHFRRSCPRLPIPVKWGADSLRVGFALRLELYHGRRTGSLLWPDPDPAVRAFAWQRACRSKVRQGSRS